MRTTITLADDVTAAVERVRRERGIGVSEAVNELVRRGLLAPERQRRFHQRSSDMGTPRLGIDDVAGLLDVLEGDARPS